METNKPSENRMGTAKIPSLILKMSFPMMLSMLAMALYNVVDSVFVSQVSENSLTAVTLAFPFQMLIVAVGVGTGVGINSLVARRLGEKRQEEAENVAMNGQFITVISAIIFTLIFALFTPTLIGFFDPDAETFELAVSYLSICGTLCAFTMIDAASHKTLQATGDMIHPMIVQLAGALTNIVLDPILIFGYLGFKPMGVAGAAWATVLGQFVSMVLAVYYLYRKKNTLLRMRFKGFKPNLSIIKEIYVVGLPSIVMQAIGSVTTFGLNAILITFSNTAVNVLGVYFKLQSFVFMPVFGLNSGAMPIMGYNFGAKNKARLMDALKYSLLYAFIIMCIGTAIFQLFPEFLLSIFNPSPDMIEMGVTAFRSISLCFPLAAGGIILSTLFQAMGRGILSLIISLCRQLILILPVAYLLSVVLSFGPNGVWYSYPIAECAALVLSILFTINTYNTKIRNLSPDF